MVHHLPRNLSRTELAHCGSPSSRFGWAYAHKSPTWHDVDAYGMTACGHRFRSRLATWCLLGMLPLVDERCRRCEARRARREAAEQARIRYATRHQLSFDF